MSNVILSTIIEESKPALEGLADLLGKFKGKPSNLGALSLNELYRFISGTLTNQSWVKSRYADDSLTYEKTPLLFSYDGKIVPPQVLIKKKILSDARFTQTTDIVYPHADVIRDYLKRVEKWCLKYEDVTKKDIKSGKIKTPSMEMGKKELPLPGGKIIVFGGIKPEVISKAVSIPSTIPAPTIKEIVQLADYTRALILSKNYDSNKYSWTDSGRWDFPIPKEAYGIVNCQAFNAAYPVEEVVRSLVKYMLAFIE